MIKTMLVTPKFDYDKTKMRCLKRLESTFEKQYQNNHTHVKYIHNTCKLPIQVILMYIVQEVEKLCKDYVLNLLRN